MHKEMKIEKLTIAHISDLHRSPDRPITNTALLGSLLRDLDSYATEGIAKPDLLIVSGDLVHGGNDEAESRGQYSEAFDFLCKVTDELFNGDRSKVVLVPGNHDVSWAISNESMEKIEETEIADTNGDLKKEILLQINKAYAGIKWSWRDRSFYRVSEKAIYNARLVYFAEMYQDFYGGQRTYSLEPDSQLEIFDYEEFGITIVGFNSCFNNDHLNRAGSINPECIAKAGMELRGLKKRGRLIMSTWHHNTKGGPYDQDYMEDTFLRTLISDGVKFAFHGHQHRKEVIRLESNIIDQERIFILSAGSLCAGPSELPSGHSPQYNIIELSRTNDEKIHFKLFSREKIPESPFDNPVWCAGVFGTSATNYSDTIEHKRPPDTGLSQAEKFVGERRYREAIELLENIDLEDPLVRMLLLECYLQEDNYSAILRAFIDPKNNAECVALINSGLAAGNNQDVEKILNIASIEEAQDHSIIHLREQLKGKRK